MGHKTTPEGGTDGGRIGGAEYVFWQFSGVPGRTPGRVVQGP